MAQTTIRQRNRNKLECENNIDGITACSCQNMSNIDSTEEAIDELYSVRKKCPVLSDLFIPDEILKCHKHNTRTLYIDQNNEHLQHQSKLVLGIRYNYLKKITAPSHSFLIKDGKVREEGKKNYRNDLNEKWLFKKTEIDRHKKSRAHNGKLFELHIASWLQKKGWEIINLEAMGGNCDIQAKNKDGDIFSVEVKYIGREDRDLINSVSWYNVNSLHDFILLKAYDGVEQLKDSTDEKKMVIVVLSELEHKYSTPFSGIPWKNLTFQDDDEDFKSFLEGEKKKGKYSTVDRDLKSVLQQLDIIQVVQLGSSFDFQELDILYH
ncbi:MAG: hypothetical protein HQ538_04525 [Parcubacteria group bacterium]|nr:hypothetical protein [Parcubacteria group bacterium]